MAFQRGLENLATKASWFLQLEKEKVPMKEKRQGEIALALVKAYLSRRGVSISRNTMRELGSVAKETGISGEELKQFAQLLIQAELAEIFETLPLSNIPL